jgi:hypothetical protein
MRWRQVIQPGAKPQSLTSHCGAGCVIGDIIAEFSLFALGWTLVGKSLYAEYVGDILLAWLFGIVFQYFAIAPMRNLSLGQGLIAAVKSDTLSILTFEIGLFAWMALTFFVLFPHPHLQPTEAGYWFMMQIGMILRFFTSYPMNRWLIKAGWKVRHSVQIDPLPKAEAASPAPCQVLSSARVLLDSCH